MSAFQKLVLRGLTMLVWIPACLQAETVQLLNDSFDGTYSGDWTIENADADSIATADGDESPFSATAGGASLSLDDHSTNAEVNLRYTLPNDTLIADGESLAVQFDWYSVDAKLPLLAVQDGISTSARLSLLGDFNHNELEGGTKWETLASTVAGTWYRVAYTYHNDPVDTVDISLTPYGGSTTTWTNRSVEVSKSSVNSIVFTFNVNSASVANEWWIDNVTVTRTTPDLTGDDWFANLRSNRVQSDPSIVWRQFGPGMSGNNYRMYWHPTDPDILFLGPNMGNAYRSTDRGTTYEGLLDCDGDGHSFDERGPIEIQSPDFSHQNPDFGICSREAESKIYITYDRGKTWTHDAATDSVWGEVRLNTIEVDPSNDQVWFVGSGDLNERNDFRFTAAQPHGYSVKGDANEHVAKIWRTTNQGAEWTDVTPGGLNADACIVRIVVHPEHSDVVWAATTYGLYKSTDGGSSWAAKTGTGLDSDIIRSFDMHYDLTRNQVTLFAVDQVKWAADGSSVMNAGGGIFRSDDEGESWTRMNGDLGIDVSVLASDDSFTNTYFNALNKWFGIDDASAVYTDYPTDFMNNFSMVRVDPNNVNKVFILNDYKHYGGWTTPRGGMVWRTDNGGLHWFATLRNGTAWEGIHKSYWEGRGNPTAHNIFLRGQKKWEQRESYERKAGAALEFNSDGTVLSFQWAKTLCFSFDGGDTWKEMDEIEATPGTENWVAAGNSNLPGHGLRQDARFPNNVFCPAGENDFWITRADGDLVRSGAQSAYRNELGDSEYSCADIAFHPDDTNTLYSLQFRQASAGMLRMSTDGGETFTDVGRALEWPTNEVYNTSIDQLCLTIEPDNPSNMYFCVPRDAAVHGYTWDPKISPTTGVRRTTNSGVDWEWANEGLPSSHDVPCVRLDPDNSTNLYACVYGSGGGLYVSTDHAVSWSKFSTLPSGIYSVSDIHFANDGKIYISCGYHNDSDYTQGGVWVSDDEGETWTHIFKTVWARMTKTAAYDPDVILVQMNSKGTSDIKNPGTYVSEDGGVSWAKINTGNPQSDRVNDIAIDQVQRNVYYVSTQGCGWLRADPIDPDNDAPVFANASIERSNAVPAEVYAGTISGEASDINGHSIDYSLIFGPDWLSVDSTGSLSGTPDSDALGSYLCQVQADDGNGMSSREIMNFVVSTNPAAYYASWLRGYSTLGDQDAYDDDPDGDGLDNLSEYGLGGTPDVADADVMPTFEQVDGAWVYVYRQRSDADKRGLSYSVDSTTNLVTGTWTNLGLSVTGTGDIDDHFEAVTNAVSATDPNRFIRLQIETK